MGHVIMFILFLKPHKMGSVMMLIMLVRRCQPKWLCNEAYIVLKEVLHQMGYVMMFILFLRRYHPKCVI